jgi:hypothetical protein
MYNWNSNIPNNFDKLSDEELQQIQAEVQRQLSRISILHTYLIEERILRAEKNNGRKRTET